MSVPTALGVGEPRRELRAPRSEEARGAAVQGVDVAGASGVTVRNRRRPQQRGPTVRRKRDGGAGSGVLASVQEPPSRL